MNADGPEADPQPSTCAIAAPDAADGSDLPSLAALAVAADPALLGHAGSGETSLMLDGGLSGQADAPAYEGHVALILDPGLLPVMDGMLDLLTTSHDLFDVPAMDIAGTFDDTPTA